MKITVTGHICLDLIHHPGGKDIRSYGGIFFAVTTLANLLPTTDTIYPVLGIGREDYEPLIERLSVYPNIDPSGIYKYSGPSNTVELFYKENQERIECSKNIAEPVPFKKIRPYLETDVILVNMISGFDIALETMDEIRMEVRDEHIPIYFDLHSLTLGQNEDFTRFQRPVETWRRWAFMVHAVQMNETEAAIVSPEKLDEDNLAKHILALNTNALIITRGENGCTAFIDEHKHTKRVDIPGIHNGKKVRDATGCGDVFGAAYCAQYMYSKNIVASVEFANRVAAFKVHLPGSTEIDKLQEFRLTTPVTTGTSI